ncbi:MAG: HAMP domain-containing sensor histidine kinase, partial [Spirochaetia bacterium]|nr:HAMP domain-containing sensor histidine kinase [Spirochaetia bacterium]
LIFVSIIIFSGLNIALKGWYRASESRYSSSIVKTLEKLYSQSDYFSVSDMREALDQFLGERFSLVVFSPDGEIILSHNLKRNRIPPGMMMAPPPQIRPDRNPFSSGRQGMNRKEGSGMMPPGMHMEMMPDFFSTLTPVVAGGRTAAFVWVKSARFETEDSLNRRLLQAVFFTLFIGITLSVGAAILSTSFISGRITKEASAVSGGLEKLAAGSRDVLFPEGSSNEITTISKSALILQERLSGEERARKQWTQDIAHDLRTPTTAIKAQIEAMADGVLTPDRKRLEMLLSEVERLENLIEDMNRLTSIESPEASLTFSEISAEKLAIMLRERFAVKAKETGVDLQIDNDDFTIRCDINLLTRALSNLVQNSIQYSIHDSSKEALIRISISKSDREAVISVENPGEIPENEIKRIFDRLYRGEFSRSARGSGLGLTIAKAAIEKHGGTITAGNIQKDKESIVRFTVRIPGFIC